MELIVLAEKEFILLHMRMKTIISGDEVYKFLPRFFIIIRVGREHFPGAPEQDKAKHIVYPMECLHKPDAPPNEKMRRMMAPMIPTVRTTFCP